MKELKHKGPTRRTNTPNKRIQISTNMPSFGLVSNELALKFEIFGNTITLFLHDNGRELHVTVNVLHHQFLMQSF